MPNKIYIAKYFLAIVFSGMIYSAVAQLNDYHLQIFDHTSGILPGSISQLVKDKKGLLWILYGNKVQCFDGQLIQTYSPATALQTFYCDKSNRIWVCAESGPFLFSEKKNVFEKIPVKAGTQNLLCGYIMEFQDGLIALLTDNGFFAYNQLLNQFEQIKEHPFLLRMFNPNASEMYKNFLFIHNDKYLFRYNIQTKQVDSLPAIETYGIYPISGDSIMINTRGDVVRWYDFKTKKITTAYIDKNLRTSFNLRNIVSIAPSRFLLASSAGLIEYDALNKLFLKRNFFLDGMRVATNEYATYIYYDEMEGNAWISTNEGVAKFAVRDEPIGFVKVKQMDDEISAGIDDIRRIIEDKNGNIWTATGYGFACFNKISGKWKVFPPTGDGKKTLNHESIRGLQYDGKYLILGPTSTGVWLFDPETETYKHPHYTTDAVKERAEKDFISDIIKISNGDFLISARSAFYILKAKTYAMHSVIPIDYTPEFKNVTANGSDGITWVGSSSGLYYMDSSYKKINAVSLPNNFLPVSSGMILRDNSFLFSCTGGLFTAKHEQNGSISIKKMTSIFDGMPLAITYLDSNGVVWGASDKGIVRFNPAKSTFRRYDYSDNIQGYTFNHSAWYKDSDGRIYFGGTNGLNYWHPESFSVQPEPYDIYVRKLRVGNKEYSPISFDSIAPVKYNERSIDVEFGAAYFNNPEKVKYRYKLEGVDKEWKDAGAGNLIRFTSLSPGHYTFKIQGSLNQVDWKDAKAKISFEILPPFWLTWWFLTLCSILIIGIVLLIMRNHRKKIREKQEELEAEQSINHFSSSIHAGQSVDDILWDVARNCISQLSFEDCVIYLVDEDRQTLIQKAAYGPKSSKNYEITNPLEIPVGKGITGTVALTGKPEIVNDTSVDSRYIVDDAMRYSEITIPIKAGNQVLGVIDCEHSKKRFFTQRHLFILTTIASLCASRIVRSRIEGQKQEAERVLRDTQQKMAEIEMQALRAQMNPHFIFNCLNSINRYIVKSDQATASLYLTRFAKLIRLILDNSNNKSVSLSSELEALRLYIEMESIRFEKQFTYSISVDKDVQPDYIYVPPLIIQPFVENAIWHGLLHKETAGHLHISFSRKIQNILECVIEDDGVGREKAKELKSKSTSTKKSLGMKLTEDRLSLLNRQAMLDATVEVLDLKDRAGEASGTKVILKIPVDAY
ncbi:MAG: histidine kinase [Chitinophagaceae bacterium]|nr:histidine kinase [Chitinophagaceae bacterium]